MGAFKKLVCFTFPSSNEFIIFFEAPFHFLIDILCLFMASSVIIFLACCHIRVISIPTALAIYLFL